VASLYLMQMWRYELYLPLCITVFFLGATAIRDWKFFNDVFNMRTTKNGLSFGVATVLVVILLSAINFIAVQQNKSWDFTEEKLNSLSDQSISVVQALDSPIQIRGFYGSSEMDENEKQRFMELAQKYTSASSKVGYSVVDIVRRADLVKQMNVQSSGEIVFTFKGKNQSVFDISEQAFTNAIVKMGRSKELNIYYLQGHQERDLSAQGPIGASRFKKGLEDSSYVLKELNLINTGAVPTDADMVLILGPQAPLLPAEIEKLISYADRGGKLFIAADPSERQNIGQLTKPLGILFQNNFIYDEMGRMQTGSNLLVIGLEFGVHEIVNKFNNTVAGLLVASSLVRDPKASENIVVNTLVKSGPLSYAKSNFVMRPKRDESDTRGPFELMLLSRGKVNEKSKGEFIAVVVGDSDFITNQIFETVGINRDLALNSVAFLGQDLDLISIRPKLPKGSVVIMTQLQQNALVLGFLAITLAFFLMAFVSWFRRRGA